MEQETAQLWNCMGGRKSKVMGTVEKGTEDQV